MTPELTRFTMGSPSASERRSTTFRAAEWYIQESSRIGMIVTKYLTSMPSLTASSMALVESFPPVKSAAPLAKANKPHPPAACLVLHAIDEACSIIDRLASRAEQFFSRGYLNSEGRKLVAKLLRLLAEADPKSFRRLKRLYPGAPEDEWIRAVLEVGEGLRAMKQRGASARPS